MNTYDQHTMKQRKADYLNIVLPFLTKSGYEEQKMINLFKNGQVRVQWGKDFNNFTVHLTNSRNEPTCIIDELVHSIWNGVPVSNKLVLGCCIKKKGFGPISSIAITDLYTLASGLKKYGTILQNPINGQSFLRLPFGHPSLSNNIWGIGIKNF